MTAVQSAGAGRVLRAGATGSARLAGLVARMLADSTGVEAARRLAASLARHHPNTEFNNIINEIEESWRRVPTAAPGSLAAAGGSR